MKKKFRGRGHSLPTSRPHSAPLFSRLRRSSPPMLFWQIEYWLQPDSDVINIIIDTSKSAKHHITPKNRTVSITDKLNAFCRAGFTPSGPLSRRNVGPLIYEAPLPTVFTRHAHSHHRPVLQCTLLLQQQLSGSLRPAFLKQTVSDGVILTCLTHNRHRKAIKCQKWKIVAAFVGAPVQSNMLNMPQSASGILFVVARVHAFHLRQAVFFVRPILTLLRFVWSGPGLLTNNDTRKN